MTSCARLAVRMARICSDVCTTVGRTMGQPATPVGRRQRWAAGTCLRRALGTDVAAGAGRGDDVGGVLDDGGDERHGPLPRQSAITRPAARARIEWTSLSAPSAV